MFLLRHLGEDALGNVVVSAPVGCTLRKGELIEVMAACLLSQLFRDGVYRAGILYPVDFPTMRTDRVEFWRGSRVRHHGNKA